MRWRFSLPLIFLALGAIEYSFISVRTTVSERQIESHRDPASVQSMETCRDLFSTPWTACSSEVEKFIGESLANKLDRPYSDVVMHGATASQLNPAVVAGEIRAYVLRYSQVRTQIRKRLAKSNLNQSERQEALSALDRRARELVTHILKEFSSKDLLAEFESRLGAEELESIKEQFIETLGSRANELAKLEPGEQLAIFYYMGGHFDEVNGALRGTELNNEDWSWAAPENITAIRREIYRPEITLAISGLSKLAAYNGRVTRVINLEGALLESYREGAVLTELGFTSSTKGDEGASTFSGNAVLEIQSKTGRSVGALNTDPEENEVLFAPGARFKIEKISRKHGLMYVQMTEQ